MPIPIVLGQQGQGTFEGILIPYIESKKKYITYKKNYENLNKVSREFFYGYRIEFEITFGVASGVNNPNLIINVLNAINNKRQTDTITEPFELKFQNDVNITFEVNLINDELDIEKISSFIKNGEQLTLTFETINTYDKIIIIDMTNIQNIGYGNYYGGSYGT